jgi:hypothetical protein
MRRGAFLRLALVAGCLLNACAGSTFSGSGGAKSTKPERTESSGDATPLGDSSTGTAVDAGGTFTGLGVGTSTNTNIDSGSGVVTPNIDSGDVVTPTITDLVITAQEGKTVEACFSYDKVKMSALVQSGQAQHGHMCDEAVFDVTMSGTRVGQINLNNGGDLGGGGGGGFPPGGIPPGSGGFPPGGGLGDISGPSVLGGKFQGRWINGVFDVVINCALSHCHDDVTFLSIIGEVVTTGGKTMWLKIDQGIIYPGQTYAYNFGQFTLSDVKPSFGAFCELQ